ncbi:MAG: hypothetical protein ACR2FK_01785 [Sphingomicrobium sp.]
MPSKFILFASMIAVTVSGCSSRPREFTPMLAAPPVSSAAFDASYAECSQLLVAGKLDKEGRLASGAGGAAAGAGLAAAGAATAAGAAGYAGLAVAAATIVLLPFAVLGGAWGMSKMKRAKKENAIKTVMAGCLKERGHEVTGWAKADKKAKNAGTKALPASSR